MSFKLIHLLIALVLSSGCGVKSKPVAPRDPSLDQYIDKFLKKDKKEAEEKKKQLEQSEATDQ